VLLELEELMLELEELMLQEAAALELEELLLEEVAAVAALELEELLLEEAEEIETPDFFFRFFFFFLWTDRAFGNDCADARFRFAPTVFCFPPRTTDSAMSRCAKMLKCSLSWILRSRKT
jgi:hypothetical protein